MSTVNFNDTTPGAPAGVVNIKFQSDASGNISAYDPVGTSQTWGPTISAGNPMTISTVVVTFAEYIRFGPLVYIATRFTGTLGGTLTAIVSFNLAVASVDTNNRMLSGLYVPPSGNSSVAMVFTQGSTCFVTAQAAAAYPVSGSYEFRVSGVYRCA